MPQVVTVPNNFVCVFHTITKDLGLPLPWPRPDGYEPEKASEPILMYVPFFRPLVPALHLVYMADCWLEADRTRQSDGELHLPWGNTRYRCSSITDIRIS